MIVVGARLFAALALAVWIALSAGQLPAFAQPADDPLRHGYALLIGISHYRDGGWGQLEDVPVEIDKLKAGLARHFDSVETALDLTESEMESRIRKFLDDHENEGDSRLLIYYSGHGYTETFKQYGERRGFVTGVDTPAPDGSRDAYNKARGRALSMNEIRQMLSDSPAHAVMMIFDSCFSGTIFTDRSPNELGPSTSDRVKQWMAQPARDILTAGDSTQKVPAQSPMPDLLLSAIDGGADKYGFGVVSASDIETYMRANLNGVNLSPHAGRLDRPAFAEGRFLFRALRAPTSPSSDRDAVGRLQTAADQSQPEAQFNLGLAKMRGDGGAPPDKREGVRLVKLAAAQGYTEAEAALGSYYITGEGGLGVDKREAVRLFRLAADKGNTFAQVSLGTAYMRGDGGLPLDPSQAVSLWRKAVDKQDVDAQVHLGIAYLQGQGVSRNTVEGVRLLQLAADQGDPHAEANLGVAYERGDGGLPRDGVQAVRLYQKAADHGLPEAKARLGIAYMQGNGGLPRDQREAVRLFREAAQQGDPIGQANLGIAYTRGDGGLPLDLFQAVSLFRNAVEQGYAQAKANLGVAYLRGDGGLPVDPQEAVRLFKEAAASGDPAGQVQLGVAYTSGAGGLPVDYNEAIRLFQRSASQSNSDGEYFLGVAYQHGDGGLPVNLYEADRLFRLAAAKGHLGAINALGGRSP